MRAHYLQHVPFEGLGSIESWLRETGYQISVTRLFAGDEFPDVADIELLIIMGGPMSINDERGFPWLVGEKKFIAAAIEKGIPILGVCLGAQLIASASGAVVYPNPVPEIGWFPIEAAQAGNAGSFEFPDSVEVFHWHGETFDLPEGAVHLARSAACENQAFQLANHVIGLQFHLETTADSAAALCENCADELVAAQWVQSAEAITGVAPQRYEATNTLMRQVLEYLHASR